MVKIVTYYVDFPTIKNALKNKNKEAAQKKKKMILRASIFDWGGIPWMLLIVSPSFL